MKKSKDPSNDGLTLSMGIDIYKGSPRSRERATYAVSIVDENHNVIYEAKDVNIGRIIRLAFEYRPKYIVIDNLFELASSKRNVYRILSLFPYESRILLATYDPDKGFRDLKDIAFEHKVIDTYKKLDPVSTARTLAILGIYGVGYSIREWEERCRIIVAKGRSGKAGGSSEDRYVRNLRGVVLRITRKIKSILDENGISYQLTYRKSEGGLDRAEFIVDTSRERLYGLIKPRNGRMAKIIIRPIIKSKITLPSKTATPPRFVIVGIDPGISYGVAIMDLSGNILHTETVKNTDTGYLVSIILKYGNPILIATDKAPVPEAVRKISAVFGSRLYEPPRLYGDLEKSKMVESYGYKYSTIHERDAIFACIMAYRSYQRKFYEAEKILKIMNIKIPVDRIKAELVKGLSVSDSIERAIEEYMSSEESLMLHHDMYDRLLKNIIANEGRLRNLEHKYNMLLQENEKLRNEIRRLKSELDKVQLDYETYKKTMKYEIAKEREIFSLEERLRSCRDAYRGLEAKILQLKEENESLRRLILEYGNRKYIKIPIVRDIKYLNNYLDESIEDSNDKRIVIYVKKNIDDIDIVRSIVSKINKSVIILNNECSFKILGTIERNIACIDDPSIIDKLIVIDQSYGLIELKVIEMIKEKYSNFLKLLPSHEINSEDDLIKIIESYRNTRS